MARVDALERAKASGRPLSIALLDEGLADARERVDRYADELAAFDRAHADILNARDNLRQALRDAEEDRYDTEGAILRAGFAVYTREAWDREHPPAGDVSGTP